MHYPPQAMLKTPIQSSIDTLTQAQLPLKVLKAFKEYIPTTYLQVHCIYYTWVEIANNDNNN